MANLPVDIIQLRAEPLCVLEQLAWTGALIITVTVLASNHWRAHLGAERTQ